MAHYLVVAAMVWDIAYLKRKWLQRQVAGWGWTRLKETPQYIGLSRRDGAGMDAGVSPGSAKQGTCHVHPYGTPNTAPARRW